MRKLTSISTKLRAMALQRKNFPEQSLLYAAANSIDASKIKRAIMLARLNDAIEKIEEVLGRP